MGSSLTTISPTGTKQETKVFAGGTLIAIQTRGVENNQNFDSVEWRTADPVTGTVGRFGYYQGVASLFTEETEPLGQTVRENDPMEPPQPQPNDSNIGSADDPHYQCKDTEAFWGGFSGMPFHCQKKALYGAGTKLPWEDKEESPIKVSQLRSSPLPIMNVSGSFSDQILSRKLTLTSKFDKEKKGKDNSKDDTVYVDASGVSTVNIPISPIDMNNTEVVSASESGTDGLVLTFVSNQEAQIAEQLRNMANESCANAFKEAGLMTPKQVVGRGITIFPAYLLNSPTDMKKFGLSSDSTQDLAFRNAMKAAWDANPSTNDITTSPGYEYKGRAYMAFPQRAFRGDDGPFGDSFVHAMMHAAGAKGRNTHSITRWRYKIGITPEELLVTEETIEVTNSEGQHDLTWMNKKLYDGIIENCAKK